jgi:hypothetical protein
MNHENPTPHSLEAAQAKHEQNRPFEETEAIEFWKSLTKKQKEKFLLKVVNRSMGTFPDTLMPYVDMSWEEMPEDGITTQIQKGIMTSGRWFKNTELIGDELS